MSNMTDTKFTKGEWLIVDSTDQSLSIWASESECITTINYSFWDETYKAELKANAHLIASAPAMYKLLDELKRHMDLEYSASPDEWIDDINKILSKAKGE